MLYLHDHLARPASCFLPAPLYSYCVHPGASLVEPLPSSLGATVFLSYMNGSCPNFMHLWSVAPVTCGDKVLDALVLSFLQHEPHHPDCTPTSFAAMLSVCTEGWAALVERPLTQLLSSRSEKYECTYNKNKSGCSCQHTCQYFLTLRIQQPDCCKFLWELSTHMEPSRVLLSDIGCVCTSMAAYTVLCMGHICVCSNLVLFINL